jgi:hypothetical protein
MENQTCSNNLQKLLDELSQITGTEYPSAKDFYGQEGGKISKKELKKSIKKMEKTMGIKFPSINKIEKELNQTGGLPQVHTFEEISDYIHAEESLLDELKSAASHAEEIALQMRMPKKGWFSKTPAPPTLTPEQQEICNSILMAVTHISRTELAAEDIEVLLKYAKNEKEIKALLLTQGALMVLDKANEQNESGNVAGAAASIQSVSDTLSDREMVERGLDVSILALPPQDRLYLLGFNARMKVVQSIIEQDKQLLIEHEKQVTKQINDQLYVENKAALLNLVIISIGSIIWTGVSVFMYYMSRQNFLYYQYYLAKIKMILMPFRQFIGWVPTFENITSFPIGGPPGDIFIDILNTLIFCWNGGISIIKPLIISIGKFFMSLISLNAGIMCLVLVLLGFMCVIWLVNNKYLKKRKGKETLLINNELPVSLFDQEIINRILNPALLPNRQTVDNPPLP